MITQEEMIAHAQTLEQMHKDLAEDGRFATLAYLVSMAADVAYETCGSFTSGRSGQAGYDLGGYDPSR